MKMKKGLLSVAALLATSSVMAAMSFSSAEVESDMNVTVKNSDSALLALTPSSYHNAAYQKSGVLEIDLDKGNDYKEFGVQKDSEYTWDKLFKVTNNSEHTIEVTVDIDGDGTKNVSPTVLNVGGYPNHNDSETLKIKVGERTDDVTFELDPGEEKHINLEVETGSKNPGTQFNYEIDVTATSVPDKPNRPGYPGGK